MNTKSSTKKAVMYFSRRITADGVWLPGLLHNEEWEQQHSEILNFAEPYLVHLDDKNYVSVEFYARLTKQMIKGHHAIEANQSAPLPHNIFNILAARRLGYVDVKSLNKNCRTMPDHYKKLDTLYARWAMTRNQKEKQPQVKMGLRQYYFYHDVSLVKEIERVLSTYTDNILKFRQTNWDNPVRRFEGNEYALVFGGVYGRVASSAAAKIARNEDELKRIVRALFVWHHRRHLRREHLFYSCGVLPDEYRESTRENRLIGGFVPPESGTKEDDWDIPGEHLNLDD